MSASQCPGDDAAQGPAACSTPHARFRMSVWSFLLGYCQPGLQSGFRLCTLILQALRAAAFTSVVPCATVGGGIEISERRTRACRWRSIMRSTTCTRCCGTTATSCTRPWTARRSRASCGSCSTGSATWSRTGSSTATSSRPTSWSWATARSRRASTKCRREILHIGAHANGPGHKQTAKHVLRQAMCQLLRKVTALAHKQGFASAELHTNHQ